MKLDIRSGDRLIGKRVLITAGPTWVAIDKVRVISNIATGKTGILLAEKLSALGAKVTLLLGPVEVCCLNRKIKLISFKFFEELNCLFERELKNRKYDIIVHSAAVADYAPAKIFRNKVRSGIKNFQIKLAPTVKIIDLLRKISPRSFIVGFKFEPDAKKQMLLKEAADLMRRANLDLVVANSNIYGKYSAYFVGSNINSGPYLSKEGMVDKLVKIL